MLVLCTNFQSLPFSAYAQKNHGNRPLEFNRWVELGGAEISLEELVRAQFAPWFTIPSTDEWRPKQQSTSNTPFQDVRFGQYRKGVPIRNGEIIVHLDEKGKVVRINGALASDPTIIEPQLSWEFCASKAQAEFNALAAPHEKSRTYEARRNSNSSDALQYFQRDSELPLEESSLMLCYEMLLEAKGTEEVTADARFVLVDAHSGSIVRNAATVRGDCNQGSALTLFNGWRTITTKWRGFPNWDYVTIDECRGDGIYSWVPYTWNSWFGEWIPIDDSDNQWSLYEERPVTSALWAGEMTYDYWWNVHGRNSWDANGGMVRIRARDNGWGDGSGNGAIWDDAIATIRCGTGGGDGIQYAFVGLEHIGHEFAHGISGMECGWSTSSSMETQSLDEGFADAFGVLVDFEAVGTDANYLIGENNGLAGGFARNMADPNSKNMPDTYLGTHWSYSSDTQYAKYINMGVVNYWFYLMVEGGAGVNDNGDAYAVEGLGRYDAARILYRAMYAYLGPSSQFADAKNATIYSAMDLYGACSFQVIQTINAWNAVGVESALGMGADMVVDCAPLLTAHGAGSAVTRRVIDRLWADCNIVANGMPVDFYAGESIELLPGFNSGDRFLAKIDLCMAEAKSQFLSEGIAAIIDRPIEKEASEEADLFTQHKLDFKVSPNPSTGMVTIEMMAGMYEKHGPWSLDLVSTTGVTLASYRVAGDVTLLDLSSHSGVFLLRLLQGEQSAVKRLIIAP